MRVTGWGERREGGEGQWGEGRAEEKKEEPCPSWGLREQRQGRVGLPSRHSVVS